MSLTAQFAALIVTALVFLTRVTVAVCQAIADERTARTRRD